MQFYCPSHIYAEIHSLNYNFFAFLVHCENTSQNLNMLPTRPQIRGPRKTKTDLEIFENVFFCCCLLRPLYFWINSNITIGGLLFRHTASVFSFPLGRIRNFLPKQTSDRYIIYKYISHPINSLSLSSSKAFNL